MINKLLDFVPQLCYIDLAGVHSSMEPIAIISMMKLLC
jgi:hypothetical protein